MTEFLKHTAIVDWQTPSVVAHAHELADGATDDVVVAGRCYHWVRDHVQHSRDVREQQTVTWTASSVLEHRVGYCFAKAHLLAALLRACGIPAAFCYQRLRLTEGEPRFTLHGLNAVHLKQYGWYRVDARGNKPGIDPEFCPPEERLAYPLVHPGEMDLPQRFADPFPCVIDLLESCATADAVYEALPQLDQDFGPAR